jgi:hypothetical protein
MTTGKIIQVNIPRAPLSSVWGVKMHFHAFLNSALNDTEWSASGPSILTSGKRAPLSHWLLELTGRCGEQKYCSFPDSNFLFASRSMITILTALSRFRSECRKRVSHVHIWEPKVRVTPLRKCVASKDIYLVFKHVPAFGDKRHSNCSSFAPSPRKVI